MEKGKITVCLRGQEKIKKTAYHYSKAITRKQKNTNKLWRCRKRRRERVRAEKLWDVS
jgi:hypothetical protein